MHAYGNDSLEATVDARLKGSKMNGTEVWEWLSMFGRVGGGVCVGEGVLIVKLSREILRDKKCIINKTKIKF